MLPSFDSGGVLLSYQCQHLQACMVHPLWRLWHGVWLRPLTVATLLLPRLLPLQGGNDYEIFESPDTVGHTVVGPEDTICQLQALFPSP